MTIPLGAMCNTGRIVEDVRQALFRGHATEIHIRVHPEQPQGDDAFGYAFADMLNNCAEPKQYDAAGKKHLREARFQVSDSGVVMLYFTSCVPDAMRAQILNPAPEAAPTPDPTGSDTGTGVKNAPVDAEDKVVLLDVFDGCLAARHSDGDPLPSEEDAEVSHRRAPYIERICYTTFNYRAGYTADNHVYAKETVMAAFREYTPSPFLPTPLRPSLWVVPTVHRVMYKKQGNVRNYLVRHYFKDEGNDGQGRKKRAGGIIKPNTNAVKSLAARQAVPGDNVDEGSSPEPPAKKAKQPA
eukprot:jgi/Tetstr1/437565/TSEL_026237.t1